MRRTLTIYVPEDKKLDFNLARSRGRMYFENVHADIPDVAHARYVDTTCFSENPIYYNAKQGQFVCGINSEVLRFAKDEYLRESVAENLSGQSPIKHKTEYRRNYYNTYGKASDWQIDDIEFTSENSYRVEYSDMSLEIIGTGTITENEKGITIGEIHIEKIVKNDNYRAKYYQPSPLLEKWNMRTSQEEVMEMVDRDSDDVMIISE